jgi:two-component system sensor histidine kinase CiaH
MIIMKNILKQFAEWATSFKAEPFLLARLKLAASYTLGIFVVLAVFNLLVFGLFVKDLPDALETATTELAEERLENVLFAADGLILFFVALMSYFLAGLALKPLEKSYKQQKKFVADAAHELRTPLAVMKTGAEAMLAGDSEKERTRFIKDSVEEIDYISAMVNDLLVLSKSDNLQKSKFEKVNLSELARKHAKHMQAHARQKNITLKTDIADDCIINGNKAYLKRLLTNLVQNAVDYNKPSGEVMVLLKKSGKQVELKITDTGIGIAETDLPHIFDRFYKADKSRSQKTGGAGLGLSIVEEITKMHQGKIFIKSKLGKGTTIIILFPLS